MPELPEVESTVRYLRERITGHVVVKSEVFWPRTIATHSPADFELHLTGCEVSSVSRRGKFIGIILEKGPLPYLFIHLRMSGSLDVVTASADIASHDRVILYLDNGKSIRFNDTRKFGRMYLCDSPDRVVGELGVEPLSEDFSSRTLYDLTRGRKTQVKALLLDQKTIAGLGNIYVDESLWKAEIHPCTPAHALTQKKCEKLCDAITSTLSEAIDLAGTDFGDGVVHNGMYSPLVYARDNSACLRCGSVIEKIRVQQRGTHFCPRCQRLSTKALSKCVPG